MKSFLLIAFPGGSEWIIFAGFFVAILALVRYILNVKNKSNGPKSPQQPNAENESRKKTYF